MPKRYPRDQRERTVRMAMDRLGEYPSSWAAAQALGPKLGVGAETLRRWIVQAQVDGGVRSGPTSEELAEIKRLRVEVRDLKEANEILQAASIFFAGRSTLVAVDLRVHRRAARRWASGRADLRGPARAGPPGPPRSYRSWKTATGVPARTRSDADVIDVLPTGVADRRPDRRPTPGSALRPAEDDQMAAPQRFPGHR